MSTDSFQDSLFEDPIGLRFRHAREKARWTIEAVAQQLKLPVAVLDAIEREDWARLGAPIFVRSYVGSYARALGLPETLADEVVRGKPSPPLVSIGGLAPARSPLAGPALGYVVMTLLIIAAVVGAAAYYQSPRRLVRTAPVAPAEAPVALRAQPAPAPADPNRLRFTVSSDGRIARQ
jgi:cytoskeleton protein RodZ